MKTEAEWSKGFDVALLWMIFTVFYFADLSSQFWPWPFKQQPETQGTQNHIIAHADFPIEDHERSCENASHYKPVCDILEDSILAEGM